ncbi:SsrA-binding protein [candidate division WOR_3 bacterium SM23_42]|uniref:SsrA-binding protein n=1 Tax=candidate division WOR_3 bacterium SM23_42 TaxID=1703779 RepID=A0A0S8FSI6_UNCW3|nr:MAG: SsrA-binding protein [candidate division WOR_3 bacterium SM23_42]
MKVVANNRKALHDYHILESFEAGLVLAGSEVKSLRQGLVSISDAYGDVSEGEVYVLNLHISPYKYGSSGKLNPKRKRKLLMKKREIKRLYGLVQQRGNTMIPLKIYFNERGYAKVKIGVCRRKRLYDKKEKILKKEEERKIAKFRKIMR